MNKELLEEAKRSILTLHQATYMIQKEVCIIENAAGTIEDAEKRLQEILNKRKPVRRKRAVKKKTNTRR